MGNLGDSEQMDRKKTDFGIPTLMQKEKIEDNIALLNEFGLGFLEVHLSLPPYRLENIDCARYEELALANGFFYTFHIYEEFSYAAFNSRLRRAELDLFGDVIALAKSLKSPLINIHMERGMYFTLPEGRCYFLEYYRDHHDQSLKEFRSFCEEKIGNSPLKICLENTGDFHLDYIQEAILFLLESPVFGLTWDIGHEYMNDCRDGLFFRQHLDRLKHFHIHDALGQCDHQPLGRGEVDIWERLGIAEKVGATCLVEVKYEEGLRQSLQYLGFETKRK